VTQWEIVVAVERISARYLIPALDDLLAQYLFTVGGVHADNGQERRRGAQALRLHAHPAALRRRYPCRGCKPL
jgi:hypothetical protein